MILPDITGAALNSYRNLKQILDTTSCINTHEFN